MIVARELARATAAPVAMAAEREEAGSEDPGLTAVEDRLLLRPALGALDERGRAVVLLHYYGGMTVADIADALGMPQGSVKVKLHRDRAKLRAHISDEPVS